MIKFSIAFKRFKAWVRKSLGIPSYCEQGITFEEFVSSGILNSLLGTEEGSCTLLFKTMKDRQDALYHLSRYGGRYVTACTVYKIHPSWDPTVPTDHYLSLYKWPEGAEV